jgi:hypothetical protein
MEAGIDLLTIDQPGDGSPSRAGSNDRRKIMEVEARSAPKPLFSEIKTMRVIL